jgi:hypothetical protein
MMNSAQQEKGNAPEEQPNWQWNWPIQWLMNILDLFNKTILNGWTLLAVFACITVRFTIVTLVVTALLDFFPHQWLLIRIGDVIVAYFAGLLISRMSAEEGTRMPWKVVWMICALEWFWLDLDLGILSHWIRQILF